MKHLAEFVKTTLIGGLLLLFPLFAFVYVLVRIAGALTGFIKPFLSFMPENRFVGVGVADVASVLILLFLCFVTGLLVKTSVGGALSLRIANILNRIPGYRMLARVASIMFDDDDASGTPVVVKRGHTRQIGFLVEENSADELTVFFPSAPGPFSGDIVIVKADTVERLNVPAGEVARVIATFGAGTNALLAGRRTIDNRNGLTPSIPPDKLKA